MWERTASVSRISVHDSSRRAAAGFSLAELLIALALSAMVGAAVLSAYLFMARSLARLANYQRLEVESRRALQMLNTDARMAVALASPTAASVTLTVPTAGGTTTVAYTYDSSTHTLTRAAGASMPVTLLTGVQSFAFNYYDKQDAVQASPQSIKQVDVSFATAAGSLESTAQARFTAISARMLLQNKRLMNEPL